MRFVNCRVIYSILFYILLVVLLFVAKPSLIFNDAGNIKQFGIDGSRNSRKTLFSFGVFTVSLALLSFYLFALVDVFVKTK